MIESNLGRGTLRKHENAFGFSSTLGKAYPLDQSVQASHGREYP